MTFLKILLTPLLILTLVSCKNSNKETVSQIPIPIFDFSKVQNNNFPKPIGIVNDYNQVFTKKQIKKLSKILYDYEIKTKRQIVVVTVDSISPYNSGYIYARDLLWEWDNIFVDQDVELVILICVPEIKIGITSDYKTKPIMSYEICYKIYDKTMAPEFENGNYYNGIEKGLAELIAKWK